MVDVSAIAGTVSALKGAVDISKAMIGLRDAEAFRAKSAELYGIILEAFEKGIAAREAQAAQIDRVRDLEAELTRLKAWGADKERYELKTVGRGVVAYMLKPDARGTEPPHWLCPNCYAKGQKAFFQATGATLQRSIVYKCARCEGILSSEDVPEWME
jgi:hypothetical protein